MRFYTKSISAVLASALLLTGCGDSNDSANSSTGSTSGNSVQTKQGVFIDDVVAGLKYVEGNESGLTDANGRFPYKGGTVGFYLGKIKIGEISSLSSDNKVFVQDLFNVDRSDINDSRVLKIATLLQSIDANSSTDEIEITSEVFNKFDGNVTQADSNQTIESLDVDELLRNKGINKVPKTNVERHLRNVLKSHKLIEDDTVLELKASSVENNASNVEYDSSFEISFTKDIRKNDMKKDIFILQDSNGTVINSRLTYDYDKVKITPLENLEEKEYKIVIKASKIKSFKNVEKDIEIKFKAKAINPSLQTNMDQNKNITTASSDWNFSGMARDNSGVKSANLTFNGSTSEIELKNDFFDVKKDLTVGENDYKISVIDISGNESVVEGKITYDPNSMGDYLLKTNVDRNETVTISSVWDFKGEVKSGIALIKLSLELNGVSEDVDYSDGNFSVSKNLKLGANSFKITAEESTGKTEEKTGTIYLGSRATAGGSHSGALKGDTLYTWGRNNYGQSGLGYTSSVFKPDANVTHPKTPMKVTTPTNFKSISFMQNFSVAIDENGDVYTWGYDKNGELGRGKENRDNCSRTEDCRLSIGKVDSLSNIIAVDAGLSHTLALTKDGEVYGFGTNGDGELGDGTKESNAIPVKVVFPEDSVIIKQISAGSDFSVAIDTNGQLWAWGKNNRGQMALDDNGTNKDDQLTPKKLTVGNNEKVKSVAAGTSHILALTESGDVYGWGNNFTSQVGFTGYQYEHSKNAFEKTIYKPTKIITNYKNNPVSAVYAGGNSSYILRADKKVYPWGMYGETTPDGKQVYNDLDYPEDKLTAIKSVKEMAAGALHVAAVKEDNTVFTWRWSFEGSLGGGDSTANIWFYNYPIIPVFPKD